MSRTTRRHRNDVRRATDAAEARLHQIDARLQELGRQLATLPDQQTIAAATRRHAELTRTIDQHVAAHIASVEATPPDHLVRTIGAPPSDALARGRWRQAAAMIETHRARWGVTDPTRAFGPDTHDPIERADVHAAVADVRDLLEPRREIAPPTHNLYRGLSR